MEKLYCILRDSPLINPLPYKKCIAVFRTARLPPKLFRMSNTTYLTSLSLIWCICSISWCSLDSIFGNPCIWKYIIPASYTLLTERGSSSIRIYINLWIREYREFEDSFGTVLSWNIAFLALIYETFTVDSLFWSGLIRVTCVIGLKGLKMDRNALALLKLTSGFSVLGLAYELYN